MSGQIDLEELNRWIVEALQSYSISEATFKIIQGKFERLIEEVERLEHIVWQREQKLNDDATHHIELRDKLEAENTTIEKLLELNLTCLHQSEDSVEALEEELATTEKVAMSIKQRSRSKEDEIVELQVKLENSEKALLVAEEKVKELEADLPAICDEPECDAVVACGTPTKTGYRNTCSFHKPARSEWK